MEIASEIEDFYNIFRTMATDGVKIIDGDTAHDTYWGIMDLYDSGASVDLIDQEYPIIQREYFDDFDNEIYVTAWALARWEIGLLPEGVLEFLHSVVQKKACVSVWTKESQKTGTERQKELDKLLKKIGKPNPKIRTRKKYRKVTNLYFQPDDLLTFQLKDRNYCVVICAQIDQYRGRCNYIFVPTTYKSKVKPTSAMVYDAGILGRQIGSGYDQKTTKSRQPGIERIWELSGGDCNFFFGVVKHAVPHSDLIHFKDKFERIGSLQIIEGLKETGSFGYSSSFERFEDIFGDLDKEIRVFQYKKYPVSVVCEL